MKPKLDIAGWRFGSWSVIEYAGRRRWKALCDCGTERSVIASNLTRGLSTSCGCVSREKASARRKTHGLTNTRAFGIWRQMRGRCETSSNNSYQNYGGRGIKVCDRWSSFENFLSDMGEPPDDMTLDRINNDGNYEPINCRWATRKTQCRNTRGNHLVEFNGESKCISEWAEQLGIKQTTISRRLRAGWKIDQALSMGPNKAHHNKLIEFNGERLGLVQWSAKIGISKNTLATRLSRGWTLERALNHADH